MAINFKDGVSTVTFDINQGATRQQISKLAGDIDGMSATELFRSQPNVRSVVDFIARNVAQLGLHCFRLKANNDRERDRNSLVARILASPSPAQTQYEFVYSLVADLMLYDEAWVWLVKSSFHKTGYVLRPIPVESITAKGGDEFIGDLSIEVVLQEGKKAKVIKQEELIHLHGWNPDYSTDGIPPIQALKGIIREQVCAEAYRIAVWKNSGHMSAYISRPKDAGEWSEETAKRFREDITSYKQGGPNAGGWPVLEDGMTINSVHMNATEEKYVEVAQLSFKTICRVFHVNPAMLGDSEGVTYANMREFSKMLYKETLGPTLAKVEQKLNARLTDMLATTSDPMDDFYIEFNLKQKLAGDFEEQAEVLNKSTGTPFMTVNEARATQNLPAVEGGDELVRPLNVGTATEAPEPDSDGSEAPKSAPDTSVAYKAAKKRAEAATPESENARKKIEGLFTRFADRQKRVVLAKLGTKADEAWWDQERWDKELSDDLHELALAVTTQLGGQVAADLGFSGAYDPEVTVKFLRAIAESRAGMINETTRVAVAEALKGDSDKEPADVFNELANERGEQASQTLFNTLAAFSTVEAAKHVARKVTPAGDSPAKATKTWVTRSGNSRKEHASLNGTTVDIDDKFPNGAEWPGDPVLGADGVAGCMCGVTVSVDTGD